MNGAIHWILLADLRPVISLFLLVGITSYFADYRPLRDKADFVKEAKFSHVASLTLITGSLIAFGALQLLYWMM